MPTPVSSGCRAARTFGFNASGGFVPETHLMTTGSGTVTIPVGATMMAAEVWGSGGGGGNDNTIQHSNGGDGGAGGYAYTVLSIAGHSSQTINYTVGTAGAFAAAGTGSSITSGTFTLASMTSAGGGAGTKFVGGSGGTGGGGNTTNTTGSTGLVPTIGGGTPGVAGQGGVRYGAGGIGQLFSGGPGTGGDSGAVKIVFT